MIYLVRMLSIVSGPMTRLLSLDKATIEWQAGLPPACAAATRYLDSLTLSVHRGECVVVRHADAASARVLSAAIAGSPALRQASVSDGLRFAASGLRVRRSSIREGTLSPILEGWLAAASTPAQFAQSGQKPPDRELQSAAGLNVAVSEPQPWRRRPANIRTSVQLYSPRPHLLHVLRVSRSGCPSEQEAMEWRRWATRQAQLGHAVILLTPATLPLPFVLSPTMVPPSSPSLRILQLCYGRCGPVR